MINQLGDAPSWDEIARLGRFVAARHSDAIDFDAERLFSVESFDSDPQLRDRVDRHLSVMNTVKELSSSAPTGPPDGVDDDIASRRANFSALLAMANDFRSHSDWDPAWDQSVD